MADLTIQKVHKVRRSGFQSSSPPRANRRVRNTTCASMIPLHLEPVQLHRLLWPDARFAAADLDLVLRRVHALQVGQEQPPLPAALDNHAVLLGVQLRGAVHGLWLGQHIHRDVQVLQFVGPDGVEARVARGGGNGVVDDFLGDVGLRGLERPDAATQRAVLRVQRHERAGLLQHLRGHVVRWREGLVAADVGLNCFLRELHKRMHGNCSLHATDSRMKSPSMFPAIMLLISPRCKAAHSWAPCETHNDFLTKGMPRDIIVLQTCANRPVQRMGADHFVRRKS